MQLYVSIASIGNQTPELSSVFGITFSNICIYFQHQLNKSWLISKSHLEEKNNLFAAK